MAIIEACGQGHHRVVKRLLQDPRVDPSTDNNMALFFATFIPGKKRERALIVEMLLKDPRVDPSAEHSRALRLASQNGNVEIVSMFLRDNRVQDRQSALVEARKNGYPVIEDMILKSINS